MTVFVSPMSRRSIVCFFTIGVVPLGIVSVTSMPTSWFSPVFFTETSKARSVEALIVVSVSVTAACPAGWTTTFSRPVPWTPEGVPPVEAPWMRSQIAVIERAV